MRNYESMDMFDFEELMAEVLNVSDEERENNDFLEQKFYDQFGIDFEQGFEFAKRLILHTNPVQTALSNTSYYAFVSRKHPVALMKTPVNSASVTSYDQSNEPKK